MLNFASEKKKRREPSTLRTPCSIISECVVSSASSTSKPIDGKDENVASMTYELAVFIRSSTFHHITTIPSNDSAGEHGVGYVGSLGIPGTKTPRIQRHNQRSDKVTQASLCHREKKAEYIVQNG